MQLYLAKTRRRGTSSRARGAFARFDGRTGGGDKARRGGLRVIYYYSTGQPDLASHAVWEGRGRRPDGGREAAPEGGGRRGEAAAGQASGREEEVADGEDQEGGRQAEPLPRADVGREAMREHREGRLTLRTHHVEPIALPPLKPAGPRNARGTPNVPSGVAFKLGVNPRTLERWEQGRSKPNEQAAALIWLVRKYPDTLERLEFSACPRKRVVAASPSAQYIGAHGRLRVACQASCRDRPR